MVHRIGLTGAQGTGKSTLARAVCTALRSAGVAGVAPVGGLGQALARSGLRVGMQADAQTVRRFAQAQIEREAADAGAAVQVHDRCLLDTLAYARVLGCLAQQEWLALRAAALRSCAAFSQLVWLRVGHDYPVLDANDESPEFRRAIDRALGALAAQLGIALFEHSLPADPAALQQQVQRLALLIVRRGGLAVRAGGAD